MENKINNHFSNIEIKFDKDKLYHKKVELFEKIINSLDSAPGTLSTQNIEFSSVNESFLLLKKFITFVGENKEVLSKEYKWNGDPFSHFITIVYDSKDWIPVKGLCEGAFHKFKFTNVSMINHLNFVELSLSKVSFILFDRVYVEIEYKMLSEFAQKDIERIENLLILRVLD